MPGRENKQVILKNCAPFTDRINKICNPQGDNLKDLDVVMQVYNLIEHSDIFQKHPEVYTIFGKMNHH